MNCLESKNIIDFNQILTKTSCNNCILSSLVRSKIVISRGNPKSKIMIVGQNPGAEEDREGQPFVGISGRLLDRMFEAININTNVDCYLTNAALCWTPNNTDPTKYKGVLEMCYPYLLKQFELLSHRIVIAVGKPAMESITQKKITAWLKSVCGRHKSWFIVSPRINHKGIMAEVFAIMHPAYLLRNETAKFTAWEHMKKLSGIIADMNIIKNYKTY